MFTFQFGPHSSDVGSSGNPDTSVCSRIGLPSHWYDIRSRIRRVAFAVLDTRISWVMVPPGTREEPEGDSICNVKLRGTAAWKRYCSNVVNELFTAVMMICRQPPLFLATNCTSRPFLSKAVRVFESSLLLIDEKSLKRLFAVLLLLLMREAVEANPVGNVVVGDVKFEFNRFSNPPNELEPVTPVDSGLAMLVVIAFILLSFKLFRSSPISPLNGGIAAGGVLAGMSSPPSKSSKS